jgi:hypothetical protein
MKSIADELITRGWTQRTFEDDLTGAVCLRGAVRCAIWGLPRYDHRTVAGGHLDTEARALATIGRITSHPGIVSIWNDEPGRTFDEVLRVAKQADEILAAAEQ